MLRTVRASEVIRPFSKSMICFVERHFVYLASTNAFAGDVKVFEHTPSITDVWLNGTHCAGKTFALSWTTGDVSANHLPQQNSLHMFLAKLRSAKLPSSS